MGTIKKLPGGVYDIDVATPFKREKRKTVVVDANVSTELPDMIFCSGKNLYQIKHIGYLDGFSLLSIERFIDRFFYR